MKKILAILLAMIMVLGLAACGQEEAPIDVSDADASIWNVEGTMFPLKKPVTFTVLTSGSRGADINTIAENDDFKALCKATNVFFDFVYLGQYDDPTSRDNLQNRLMGGDYGDAIMSFYVDTLSIADIQDLSSTGILVPLTKYMNDAKVMPNFNREIVINHPSIFTNMKANDGEAYYFAGCSEINAYTADEGLLMVNSAWLQSWKDARGLDHSPATMEEFEDMLQYFAEADLNGNGKKDEIPYFMTQGTYAGCMTLEHAMGMYGIATKDSTADMDIMIDDNGKCDYVYTTDTYKEALKKFAEWYSKGYIWEEIFTGNSETVTNVVSNAANNFGLCNVCENIKGFEPMLPPAIEGYQAKYHMHPSVRLGVRQPFAVITDKCENPEILAAWMDLFYQFDNYMLFKNGKANLDAGVVKYENGKYIFNTGVKTELQPSQYGLRSFLDGVELDTIDNFSTKVDLDSYYGEQARVKGYTMFQEAGIWNPTANLWPRCTILPEYQEDYAFKYTDVSSTLAEYRAKFLTGEYSIDEKWDEFQAQLVKLGVNDMRDIIQKSYDAFVNK